MNNKIWNILLLVAMFGSGITGILLIIGIKGIMVIFKGILTFYHVEFSIIMVILVFIHIHKKPIKKLFNFRWRKTII
ncbi:MAG: hypothetical protein LBT10_01395 [Methanobrevibacter sp.]|jgi:hypothetical protein|nr:hypothetical protein [Methanobrevibacter sp.]